MLNDRVLHLTSSTAMIAIFYLLKNDPRSFLSVYTYTVSRVQVKAKMSRQIIPIKYNRSDKQ